MMISQYVTRLAVVASFGLGASAPLMAQADSPTAAGTRVAPVTPAAPVAPAAFLVEQHGSGRAMILIPGLLSSGDVWRGTVDRFSGDFDMRVLTLSGFAGAAPTGAEPFLETTRDAIIQYIRDEGLERPVLVGHSLGAFLALWIAATAPDLVGPVIAVDGVPFLTALGDTTMTPEQARPQAEAIRAAFTSMSAEALGRQTGMAMTAQVTDTSWHRIGAEWGAASDPATAGRAVAEMLTTDIRDDVATIRTPVLLFLAGAGVSDADRALVRDRYRAQLGAVADARVAVATDARHFIMLDDPAFFHATVAAFLEAR